MNRLALLFLVLCSLFSGKGQTSSCYSAFFSELPNKIYPESSNLMVLDVMESLAKEIDQRTAKKKVIFDFFIDESLDNSTSAEKFVELLKDSLGKRKSSIEVVIRTRKMNGIIFINRGESKYSLNHLSALVYSRDAKVLKELFGNSSAKIDTTSTKVRTFNHEFVPIYSEVNESEGYLYLFRTKIVGRGFACNKNEDKEMTAILKLIYKKECK